MIFIENSISEINNLAEEIINEKNEKIINDDDEKRDEVLENLFQNPDEIKLEIIYPRLVQVLRNN